MKIHIFKLMLVSFLLQVSLYSFASDAAHTALTMVNQLGLGNNLGPIALVAASNAQTFKTLSIKIGNAKAKTLVETELEHLRPNYQQQWNKNLADSYALFFSSNELASITEEGTDSKYFPKVVEKKNDVSKNMQSISQRLLIDFVSKAMAAASAHSPQK